MSKIIIYCCTIHNTRTAFSLSLPKQKSHFPYCLLHVFCNTNQQWRTQYVWGAEVKRGHFFTQERKEHYCISCFVHWKGTLEGTTLCLAQWKGTLVGISLHFFLWKGNPTYPAQSYSWFWLICLSKECWLEHGIMTQLRRRSWGVLFVPALFLSELQHQRITIFCLQRRLYQKQSPFLSLMSFGVLGYPLMLHQIFNWPSKKFTGHSRQIKLKGIRIRLNYWTSAYLETERGQYLFPYKASYTVNTFKRTVDELPTPWHIGTFYTNCVHEYCIFYYLNCIIQLRNSTWVSGQASSSKFR